MINDSVMSARESTSPIECLYLNKFHHVSYGYEQRYRPFTRRSAIQPESEMKWRLSVLDIDAFSLHFNLREVRQRRGLAISYETSRLSLPVGASAVFEVYDADDPQRGELYLSTTNEVRRSYAEVQIQEVPLFVKDYFWSLKGSECEFTPRVAVSYRARLMRGEYSGSVIWCVIEDEVKYLEPSADLILAEESHGRVYWLTSPRVNDHIKTIPLSSRYWMSEYHYKRLYRLPCWNELEGYEYEAKLTPLNLAIDEERLPYKVIERYQTESVRWYLPKGKGRIGFREGRASVVKKGKKTKLGYVIKREEEKSQGLSMWALSEELVNFPSSNTSGLTQDALQMRRVKRQLYLHNPASDRIYALCLDYCYVEGEEPLLQIELEYNGRLCLPIDEVTGDQWMSALRQYEVAQSLAVNHPKAAMRCCERAIIFDRGLKTDETAKRAQGLELLQGELKGRLTSTTVSREQEQRSGDLRSLEQTIVDEMMVLIKSLIDQQDCKPSTLTKRRWLKGLLSSSVFSL